MFSYWAYVLVGKNNVGKTSFQRHLVNYLCQTNRRRLRRNLISKVEHPRASRSFETLFTCNRSFQELRSQYHSVANYFQKFFVDADVCILSTHTNGSADQDAAEMITRLRRRGYNVAGVFWSNGFDTAAKAMTILPWTEVLWIENPRRKAKKRIESQISSLAKEFGDFLIARTNSN
jgi:GTPase SAR1 family protein